MTERLYYADPYLCQFEATVTETLSWHGQPAVVLSCSAFYPTGGGQPHDTGWLQGVSVLDVVEREADKAVVHVLEEVLPDPERGQDVRHRGIVDGIVVGKVDWSRRFDYMQQHTGQHILSQAAEQLLDAATVGFHLGEEASTVDLDRAPLSAEQLDQLEAEANRIIFENRPVVARFVSRAELANLSLRKLPKVSGPVRIVEVTNFDWSPCGGTHVQATGEVGLIKIVRAERRRDETRVEFLCGNRALADYGIKNRLLLHLASHLSVGYWELGEAVERLEKEARTQRKAARMAQEQLLDIEARLIVTQTGRRIRADSAVHRTGADGTVHRTGADDPVHRTGADDPVHRTGADDPVPAGEFLLVSRTLQDRKLEDCKQLALKIANEHGCVALLGLAGDKGHLIFAAPPDSAYDVRPILRQACAVIGGGGGGRPHLAQGGGPAGDVVSIQQALDVAVQMVCQQDAAK